MQVLRCPVCKSGLKPNDKSFSCPNGHSFDKAKEGYVNLLTGSKAGSLIGDNKDMARCRREFLEKGYFQPLADKAVEIIREENSLAVLDICCGEGYYSSAVANGTSAVVLGFDISKDMVRLAAKRKSKAEFFVANMADIPVADGVFDCALHFFAPFCEKEFARVIKKGGILISVAPAAKHLWEMKQKLYVEPYLNDENAPELDGFRLERTIHAGGKISLESQADIDALFRMTPYFYHTSQADKAKLAVLDKLETQTDFLIRIYRR